MQDFVTFIDEKNRYKIYFLKYKNEVLNNFKEYRTEVEKFTNHKIKYLQSDNGTEYCNKEFDEYLKSYGIQRRFSVPRTPQQNGSRKKIGLLKETKCLMIEANLD